MSILFHVHGSYYPIFTINISHIFFLFFIFVFFLTLFASIFDQLYIFVKIDMDHDFQKLIKNGI